LRLSPLPLLCSYLLFTQVWWLVTSFAWGIIRLVQALDVQRSGPADWSFGQVAPVVLLTAPLLAVFEYIFAGESAEPEQSNIHSSPNVPQGSMQTSSNSPSPDSPTQSASAPDSIMIGPRPRVETLELVRQLDQAQDDPDYDFYKHSSWCLHLILLVACDIVILTGQILTSASWGSSRQLIKQFKPTIMIQQWLLIFHGLLISTYISNCILIESLKNRKGFPAQAFFRALFMAALISPIFNSTAFPWQLNYVGQGGLALMIVSYIFGCLYSKISERKATTT
jgi:hypothetical protein